MSEPAGPADPERRAMLALARMDQIGGRRAQILLDHFGSASAALAATTNQIQALPGFGPKLAAELANPPWKAVNEELTRLDAAGYQLLTLADPAYPPSLREIPSPPVALTIYGSLLESDRRAVAIVGSRRCTAYGRQMAERLARGLVHEGYTIVSGLARGIDGVAHQAAIDAGGRTIAVLASGLENIYPPEHRALADAVASQGAVVTEAPLDGAPLGDLFPRRNRIISGLSLAVVVVEASRKSGALTTAVHALEQDRDVFAVPGRAIDTASEGSNDLIRQGATLVTEVEHILDQLVGELPAAARTAAERKPTASKPGPKETVAPTPPPQLRSSIEQHIWDHLANDPVDVDTLIEALALPAAEVTGALTMMELRRIVRREPGNRFARR